MQIKQATLDMLDDLYKLEKSVWNGIAFNRDEMARIIETFPEGFPVVFIDDRLAGYATSARLPMGYEVVEYNQAFDPWERIHDPKGEILYLYSSQVHPDFRKHGIWKTLVGYRVDYARSNRGIKKVWAACRMKANEYGPATAPLMEDMGFRKVKEFPDRFDIVNMELLELLPPYKLEV